MTISRAMVARIVHGSLGKLALNLSYQGTGDQPEGDYTFLIDSALRDCGLDSITDADTKAEERAVIAGTEFYALRRLFRDRAAEVTSQQGSGGALGLSVDYGQSLGSLRLHVEETKASYEAALTAIGKSMSSDPGGGVAQGSWVHIDDEDPASQALLDQDLGFLWFGEGYHETAH